ncbi:calcium-binding protein [Pseudomonas fluorescens]|uniref:calcium-binding protein n=1 Tax=Pseudomonas fluorescens TaxID=294 RepID=UPI0017870EBF|nr:calcium-binding protein [Pseudomonas fluorescens]
MGAFTTKDEAKILAGKITYNAEGNDSPGSMHYSRVIHWPGNDLSGVTLGRGYDMGSRTRNEIYTHMTQAGVGDEKASKISLAHGLKGETAGDFVRNNKALIGEITKSQQISLFNLIYPAYVGRAISIYNKWTESEVGRVAWENLDPIIRDVLVDFVYQGFTAGPNPMKSGMRNSRDEMISYVQNTPAISQYEPGRRRASYLRDN